ncbi:hypothetical protein C8R44DRAFT_981935 [Mycena epipterygia]|nr:hypothetical protein C8R44DRAFT_981935 [Mycena epipterygia]
MGSLCFSSASILRCESFTSFQSQILIIPTALELIFSTTLIITNWGTGWRHLLLTAEGWSYFALALLELLSHTIPAVRDSVSVFTIVDIVLGATSFVPIFFYTLFVYLFTRGELIDTLPKRFQRIANVLLVIFIPAVIALNELSSFVGISRRTLPTGVLAIGFRTASDQQLWTFLTSLTLALLTAFEAINFCFAFYRLIRAFVDQRRIEITSTDQAHLIRGIGWITGGFKLGAIETVIGFAQGGFGGALTRRIIRFLARAFLIIGIVKGVDQMDDFAEVTKEMSSGRPQFRRSRLVQMISNPRASTFRQLSPTAGGFRVPAAALNEKRTGAGGPSMADFAQLKRDVTLSSPHSNANGNGLVRPRQRVTVHINSGAPTLHMRFSDLEMPSPAVIAESVKARPVSSSWVSIARSSRYAPSTAAPSFAFDPPAMPMPFAFNAPVPDVPVYPAFIYARGQPEPKHESAAGRGISQVSGRSSGYPDSLNAVRELAAQFPGPPAPIPERGGSSWDTDLERGPRASWDDSVAAEARRSWDSAYGESVHTRRPASPPRPNPFHDAADPLSPEAPMGYAYGGMEHPDSPEEVYRYAYDGPVSPENLNVHVPGHPYASPMAMPADAYAAAYPTDSIVYSPPRPAYATAYSPASPPTRHRAVRSDTTFGMTPQAYLSPFDEAASASASTPDTENPFQYDEMAIAPALDTGLSGKQPAMYQDQNQAYQEAPVRLRDGPRNDDFAVRTSAALLQMTQRGDGGVHEAWTPPEFTPSMLVERSRSPSMASTATRHTLKKKRRPSQSASRKSVGGPESVETFASSWLHGDMDVNAYADEEHPSLAAARVPVRIKSVGRVRAPTKSTPAPIVARHGMTRGSIYIQPITVPPAAFSSEVQIVQGGSSADSYNSEFADRP